MTDCTFCTNTAIPEYSINYAKTGLVHHCLDCAVEFGIDQVAPTRPLTSTFTEMLGGYDKLT